MIHFSCSCGRQLHTRNANAGQRVRCPDCGAPLVIPDPKDDFPPGRPRPARRPGRRAEAPPSYTGLIIGAAVAGVLILAAVVVVLVIVLGNKDSSVPAGPQAGPATPVDGFNEARVKQESTNNLRQIAMAMHNYHDANQRFPPAVVYDRDGRPLCSWRVLLLPYLENDNLYREFHFNEPWDSPHNQGLLSRMPPVYARPGGTSKTDTHYQVFDGPGAAFNSKVASGALRRFNPGPAPPDTTFEGGVTMRLTNITDGTSNTVLVIEADTAVPWTKPVDLPFGPGQPFPPPLGGLYPSKEFLVAMADAMVLTINRPKLSDATLRAAVTASGGEILGNDWGR
jgi:hypothetical protein